MLRRASIAALAFLSICAVPLFGDDRFSRLPLSFEENRGQFDERVGYLAHARDYNVMLTPEGAILDLTAPPRTKGARAARVPLRIALDGADAGACAQAVETLSGVANYYTVVAREIKAVYERVPTHSRIQYAGVYPGIDVVYYGDRRQLEYDFVVAPHADVRAIRLRFDGADDVKIDRSGDLLIDVRGAMVRQHEPVMYQVIDGVRRRVASRYVRTGARQVAFKAGRYDHDRPLIIDPVVVSWSTAIGGSADDFFNAVAVDTDGATLLTGQTKSSDFPVTFSSDYTAGDYPAIIVKLNAAGTALVYSDYFNTSGYYNIGNDIKVDAAGDAYMTGQLQNMVLIARFGPTGTVKFAGILGSGTGDDAGSGIAVDGSGNVYLTGRASSTFPTTVGAYQTAYGGGTAGGDAFVAKLNTNVQPNVSVVYATFLGGASSDEGRRITIDGSGNAYVTGTTFSTAFPTTANGYQKTYGGDISDVFVSQLSANGSTLLYSTFLGGSYYDSPYGIALDASNNVVVGGYTKDYFPTTAGVVQPSWNLGNCATQIGQYDACPDGFVAKLNPSAATSAASLVWSTYLGGTNSDWVTGLTIDNTGNVYVTGRTSSLDFPQAGPMSGYTSGRGFVAKLNSTATSIVFSSYYSEVANGLARQPSTGALFLAGGFSTSSAGQDGFVTKITGLPADSATAPTITTQPSGTTIAPGQSAPLIVMASGTAPLSYQWYAGSSGTTTSPAAGGTSSTFTTPGLFATTRYWVRVSNTGGSADSVAAKITVMFTDDPLIAGVTPVRVIHITELRTRIDLVRIRLGLGGYTWTDGTLTAGTTPVRAVHVTDLRTALGQAYTAASLTVPTWTDTLTTTTPIKALHITQLRTALASIE